MKLLAMCVAVALVASGAMAATTIRMVDQATGSSELDVTAPGVAGSVRTIEIQIVTDENNAVFPETGTGVGGLVSWGINGLQVPGAGFKITPISTANYQPGYDYNWDDTQGLIFGKGTTPVAWPALPNLSLGTIAYIDTTVEPAQVWPGVSCLAMTFKMTLPAVDVPQGPLTAQAVYAGVYPSGNTLMTFEPLVLIPEPVSALLLLAGLPLLRRRR